MAAPGPPVTGPLTAETDAVIAIVGDSTGPSANDIELIGIMSHNPNSPTTGWSSWSESGWAAISEGAIKDSAGTTIGRVGLFWRRATGSEGASRTINTTRDGDTGNDTCHLARYCRVPGCKTSGNPWVGAETYLATSFPNAVSPADLPALTLNSANPDAMSFLLLLKGGGNANYSVASWTSIWSNASTQGTDGSIDGDYRQITAGGGSTFDPANPSFTVDADTAYGVFHIMLLPPGASTLFGSLSLPVTFGKAVSGIKQTFANLAMPLSFGAVVEGRRQVFGEFALPLTFSKDVIGQRTTFGQVISPFIFGKELAGQKQTFGQITLPLSILISTAGFRVGTTQYGIVSFPIIFGKEVSGQRRAFGQIDFPITFSKDVVGQRQTFGQSELSIIFSKNVIGQRQTFGQIILPIMFDKEVVGQRHTFGQIDFPITFLKEVAAYKQTFGQILLPITTTFFVDGYGWVGSQTLYGSLSMPITFGKEVEAYRQTFGQFSAPFIFDVASQGWRQTFSGIELPLTFTAVTESGRVSTYGVIDLDLLLSMNTAGIIQFASVILNDAVALYLGETEVIAVYVGSEQVW